MHNMEHKHLQLQASEYFGSQIECDLFLDIAINVFEKYHGSNFWGKKLDCNVSQTNKTTILINFAKSEPGEDKLEEFVQVSCLTVEERWFKFKNTSKMVI